MGLRAIIGVTAFATILFAGCRDDGNGGGDGTGGSDGPTGGATEPTAGTADGGSGDSTGVDTQGIPPGDAIRQLVEARCKWLFDCCSRPELDFELGPFTASAEECVNRVIEVLEAGNAEAPIQAGPSDLLLGLTAAFAAGRIELDAQRVGECVAFLANAECTPIPDPAAEHCDPSQSAPTTDPCDVSLIVIGKQEVGEECEPALQAECVPGARCVDFMTSGVCAQLSAEGASCFGDADCATPLVCDVAGAGLCEAGAALGGACSFVDPENPVAGTEDQKCARGLRCDPQDLVCGGGTCGPGAPCAADQQCPEEHFCIFGSCEPPQDGGAACTDNAHCISGFCSTFNNTCSFPSGMPNGTPCVSHFQCTSVWCDPVAMICTDGNDPGQPCPSLSSNECNDGFCDTTDIMNPVCVAYGGLGDPCVTVSECDPALQVSCFMNQCVKLPNGEACFNNTQCDSGLCFASLCDDPTPVGSPCGAAAMGRPCEEGSFCDIPLGQTEGDCVALLGTGNPCVDNTQCWGACVEAWGGNMCDRAPATGFAWCDGM